MNIIQNGLSDYIKDTIGKMVEVSTLMKRVRLSCEEPKNMWEFPPIDHYLPTVNFGRQTGQSTAIAKYVRENPNRTVILTSSTYMRSDFIKSHGREFEDNVYTVSAFFAKLDNEEDFLNQNNVVDIIIDAYAYIDGYARNILENGLMNHYNRIRSVVGVG